MESACDRSLSFFDRPPRVCRGSPPAIHSMRTESGFLTVDARLATLHDRAARFAGLLALSALGMGTLRSEPGNCLDPGPAPAVREGRVRSRRGVRPRDGIHARAARVRAPARVGTTAVACSAAP